jgi:hypothetical protein
MADSSSLLSEEQLCGFIPGLQILEAIAKAKQEHKVLLVYLTDTSLEDHKKMVATTWKNSEILKMLTEDFVAVILFRNSEYANYFEQIYTPTQFPAVYLILNGLPLHIFFGYTDEMRLVATLKEIKHKMERANVPQASTTQTQMSTEPSTSQTQSLEQSLPSPIDRQEQLPSESTPSSLSSSLQQTSQQTQTSLEDRNNQNTVTNQTERRLTPEEINSELQRLRQKIKERREQKAKENELLQYEQERQRIESGKAFQETRKRLQELKDAKDIEELKREREEAHRYKEYLREQLRRDKLDRESNQQRNQTLSSSQRPPTLPSNTPSMKSGIQKVYNNTILKFRLLNGESLSQEFPVSETLRAVVQFLNRVCGYKTTYYLKTTFPPHVFTVSEYDRTLQELNLVPNATLILTESATSPRTSSPVSSLTNSLPSTTTSWFRSVLGRFWNFFGYQDNENNDTSHVSINNQPQRTERRQPWEAAKSSSTTSLSSET